MTGKHTLVLCVALVLFSVLITHLSVVLSPPFKGITLNTKHITLILDGRFNTLNGGVAW